MNIVMLIDLIYCYKPFNADSRKLYISAPNHARKLKFSCYVHMPSMNKMF